jgi:hypothetical protein
MHRRRPLFILLLVVPLLIPGQVLAQSGTSSALSGTVVDPSGMAVSGTAVEATEVNTHAQRIVRTDGAGHYLFSQLNPGTYQVSILSRDFAAVTSEPTPVSVGRNVALNFTLKFSPQSQTVEVTAQQGLLALDNPNTTTTLEAKTIKSLPNPGQDLTYLAQFAEGALMNTAGSSNDAKAAGGYGNVEFNGLPATSNGYILDGYDTNDPWLGLNIGLSTNLVIGLDAVEQATVNTNSFAVDQGRYAVAQVNYFTKAGTNQFHGDAYELWNGSVLNAENYFLHANDTPGNIARRPRSVVNEFGVSAGGPIRRDKLFFFGHYEGIRIALPLVSALTLPSQAFQAYVLGQLATTSPAQVPFYRNMFSLMPNANGTPVPIIGCPLENGSGCANQREASLNNSDSENLVVAKIDQTLGKQDTLWYRFQQDTGLQAAYTDPVDPIFNSYSPQPQRTLVVGYTHLFGSNLVNQLNPGASWYSSIFEPDNYAAVLQEWPIVLMAGSSAVPFTTIGGNNNTYPQGRKVTQWQINDNLTWTLGQHTLKFGINTRRLDMSDYDLGEGTVPAVTYVNLAEFIDGQAYTAMQTFPVARKERVALGNLEFYAMDTYKPSSRTTITYGMRLSWNTNETNQQSLFARPAGSFLDMQHASTQPLDQAVLAGVHNLFPATPLFIYQPRVSVAYQLPLQIAGHSGFGAFSDIIPAQIADLAAANPPYAPTFTGGLAGQVGGNLIAPAVPDSAVDATETANSRFQSLFSSAGNPCSGIAPGAPVCPLAVSANTFSSGRLKTPYYFQYNLGLEKQIGQRSSLHVDFVGTRGTHEPYQVQLNGYQTVCPGCFAPYPYQQPIDQRFASVNEFRTGAASNYAGLQTAYSQQVAGLTLRANYTLSHCLDEVSNGGLLTFSSQGILSPLPGELSRNYSNCDYDVRHNISAFGLYQIPFHSAHVILRQVLGGWHYSQTAFFHTGLPFTVLSQPYNFNGTGIFQASGPQFARRVPGVPLYRRTPYSEVTLAGTRQWLNPEAFVSVVDPATGACTGGDSIANCQFGDAGRNTVRGPHFANSDTYITKTFPLSERLTLRLDAQMFNAFNHPNFALPNNVQAGVPGRPSIDIPARFGTLDSTIAPPTGLLGVGLGGDSSPRMIALQGRIEF